MRLRGGRDLEHPPVAWLPTGVPGAQSVRLRLRLDRRDDQGRGCWHLVDLDSEAESEPIGRRQRDRTPLTCSNSLMSIQTEASVMQSPLIAPPFVGGPSGKVPGRKRGRPPIRKLEFQSHYPEPLSSPKVPKKRGRKPGFKLKSRMVMTSMANSPTSSTPEPDMSSIPQDAATVPRSATPQVLTAETSMPEDFLCDPVDSKRYAVDPSDSAFSVMATPFPPKHTYGYRGSSGGSAPLGMCRQASSPAYSPSQEAGEGKRPPGKDPSSWGVDQVVWFIKEADPQALGPHAEAFRKHEIDGHALLLLKSDMMMKYLGLKLGPALKLSYHIDRLRQNRF